MSTLTSPSVNKNTTRFAPKVKQRERRGSSLKVSSPPPTSRSTTPMSLVSTKNFKHPHLTQITNEGQDKTPLPVLSTVPPPSLVPAIDASPQSIHPKELKTTETPAISTKPNTQSPPSAKKKRPSTSTLTTFTAPTKGEHAVGVTAHAVAAETIPTPIMHDTNVLTETDSRMSPPNRTSRRKRRASEAMEPLLTLDDITHDPASTDLMQQPLSHFLDDLENGIVSKAFKDKKTKNSAPVPIKEHPPPEHSNGLTDAPGISESSSAPQLRLVNGEIVLDTSSLYIEARPTKPLDYEIVEEDSMTKSINSRTHGKQHNTYGKRWSRKETEQFYRGLIQHGTDFEMIALDLPSRSRKEIKHMFIRQNKQNPSKITETLMQRAKQGAST